MRIKLCKDCDYESVSIKLIGYTKWDTYSFCYYTYKRHGSDDWYMLVEYTTGLPLGFDSSYPGIMALLCLLSLKKEKLISIFDQQEKLNKKI